MQNFLKILEFLSRFCSENSFLYKEVKLGVKKRKWGVSPMWEACKETGGEIYAGARFKVTSSNSITTTVEGTVGVGGTGISGGTSVTWNDNQTRLHKIYAAVDLNKFTTTGANVKNWGKVTFAK